MWLLFSRKTRAARLLRGAMSHGPRLELLEDRCLLSAPGSLDPTFGVGGKVTTHFGGFDNGRELAIQPDGKIVVIGNVDSHFTLARYNSSGNLDPTFGAGGAVTTDVGSNGDPDGVVVEPDGKIVVAGQGTVAGRTDTAFVLARYTANGAPDAAFSAGGMIFTEITSGNDFATSLARQGDGKLVVAGNCNFNSGSSSDYALARYNSDGSLDPTFGMGGKVIVDLGANDVAHRIALQADGRIVVAGETNAGSSVNFALSTNTGPLIQVQVAWLIRFRPSE